MRLIDTSAWIEWLIDSDLGRKISRHIPERSEWLVPTIIQLELAKWLTRELGEEKADQVVAFTQTCQVSALDTKIALSAVELCAKFRLSTADAIVYATALAHEAELVTCDHHFKGLQGVTYFPKATR
jgi:predicted nucleic acid-binding protein